MNVYDKFAVISWTTISWPLSHWPNNVQGRRPGSIPLASDWNRTVFICITTKSALCTHERRSHKIYTSKSPTLPRPRIINWSTHTDWAWWKKCVALWIGQYSPSRRDDNMHRNWSCTSKVYISRKVLDKIIQIWSSRLLSENINAQFAKALNILSQNKNSFDNIRHRLWTASAESQYGLVH